MTLTTTRVEQYAAQFVALNDEVIATVTACPAEQWRQPSASEGWPVAVVAHHIAEVNQAFAGILETLAAGETFSPRSSMEEVHRSNAQHARDFATVGKPETLAALRANGAALVHLVDRLGDADLKPPRRGLWRP